MVVALIVVQLAVRPALQLAEALAAVQPFVQLVGQLAMQQQLVVHPVKLVDEHAVVVMLAVVGHP